MVLQLAPWQEVVNAPDQPALDWGDFFSLLWTVDALRRAGLKSLRDKSLFVAAALSHRRQMARIMTAPYGTALQLALVERPELLGILVWPFQAPHWTISERLLRLEAHFAEIDRQGPPFPFPLDQRLILDDLNDHFPGLKVVLDQPPWFMREGGLTLNLFVENFRAYSIAYALHRRADGLEVVVGGIQGRKGANDLYRTLTKVLYGLRPRDFLIILLQILCRHMDAVRLIAVADQARHHRHPYFAKDEFEQDYDVIWTERGGVLDVPSNPDFYVLPVSPVQRAFEELKPNKRSQFRQRYKFLDELEMRMRGGISKVPPVSFPDS